MPTTFTNLVPVRRVAVGVSASAQGADGVDELTRTAFDALQAAAWTEDSAAPFFPVHDYAQGLPRGDAWKACYGYDANARTERAACGAACYTFAMPADATAGTPADFSEIVFSVTGDRYLDAGVDVYVVPSASATPPTVSAILSGETPAGTYCATGTQTEPPNKRSGVTDTVEVQPGTAATAYVHVALLMHDYTGTRGAWIEGGAMLDGPALSVEFSRDVTADAPKAGTLQAVFCPENALQQYTTQFRIGGNATTASALTSLVSTVLSGAAPLAAKQLNGGSVPALSVTAGFGATSSPGLAGVAVSVADNVGRCNGTVLFYDSAPLRAGTTISIPAGTPTTLTVRAIAFDVADLTAAIDWTNPDFWTGSSRECIGSVDFAASAGATLRVSRPPSAPFVGIALVAVSTTATSASYTPSALTLQISTP
jgi:hypothetical protein